MSYFTIKYAPIKHKMKLMRVYILLKVFDENKGYYIMIYTGEIK